MTTSTLARKGGLAYDAAIGDFVPALSLKAT
jgi:hypothetical protein